MALPAMAIAQGAASVINGTVKNLMMNKVYQSQVERMQFQNRLDQMNSSQRYQLAAQLQAAQTDAERFRIMQDAVSKIDVATVQGNASILSASVTAQSKNTMTTVLIITGGLVILVAAYYVINKD